MTLPFDRAHLSTFTSGDLELERELLESFQTNAKVHLENMHGGLTDGTWSEMAHRFKGAASGIGMQALAGLCAAAEAMTADEQAQHGKNLLSAMADQLALLDDFLSR